MNDVLKLIDRAVLRPFGYRIQRAPAPNLLRPRNLDELDAPDSLEAGRLLFERQPAEPAPAPARLTVYVRTCLSAARGSKTHNVVPEPLDTVIPTCLASLVASVEHAVAHAGLEDVRVVVADDRSEPAGRERIERVFARLSVPWEIATPEVTKAGPVMHSQFAAGAGQDRLVYFCEDDYLHVPEAVTAMVAFYRQVHGATGGQLMLHPQEQRSLYVRHYPSYLLMGADRHWRTTSDMSHTLFTHGKAVEAYWSYFENTKYMGHPRARVRHKGSERRTTNRLLGVIPGFCPIPALAAHFQEERLLPPYFQWRELYAANRVD